MFGSALLRPAAFYSQSSSDLPLLVTIRDLTRRLLSSLLSSNPNNSPRASSSSTLPRYNRQSISELPPDNNTAFRIGFITPPFRDNKIPVTDHLHAHAYILPGDLLGWWRGVGYSGLAWYDIDDLIAEIRYANYPLVTSTICRFDIILARPYPLPPAPVFMRLGQPAYANFLHFKQRGDVQ